MRHFISGTRGGGKVGEGKGGQERTGVDREGQVKGRGGRDKGCKGGEG